jgi:hypothetical protein
LLPLYGPKIFIDFSPFGLEFQRQFVRRFLRM